MAIYLDANVLWPWRTFAEPQRLALSIVADQLDQRVVVPWIAAEEGAARHRRVLESAVETLTEAESALKRAFSSDGISIEVVPRPNIEDDVERWQVALAQLATVLPLEDHLAREALRREIYGVPPARRTDNARGLGARDAAIWLSVLDDHARRREPGHFISANTKDFGPDGYLRPELAAEVADNPPLTLHVGLSPFLERLGTVNDTFQLGRDLLAEWAASAVAQKLADSLAVVRAVEIQWGPPGLWVGARVQSATPTEITSVRRYERRREAVTVVDARWTLIVSLHVRRTDAVETVRVVDGVQMAGSVQLYLPEEADRRGEPSVIGAQLRSSYELDLRGGIATPSPWK